MTTATIVHHQGSEEVTDFHSIEEIESNTADAKVGAPVIRVWYDDPEDPSTNHVDYYVATIVNVQP